jgi:hypothetical protein
MIGIRVITDIISSHLFLGRHLSEVPVFVSSAIHPLFIFELV